MTHHQRKSLFSAIGLFAVIFGGYAALWRRNHIAEVALQRSLDEVSDLRAFVTVARIENRAFVTLLNRAGWNSDFLIGTSTNHGAMVRLPTVEDGIYYLMKASCGACPKNYPALERLYSLAPDKVHIVSIDDSATMLRGYISQYDLKIPIVASADGRLLRNIPDYATPLTLVFKNGVLSSLVTGEISRKFEASFVTEMRSTPNSN